MKFKKILCVLFVLFILVSFCSCASNGENSVSNDDSIKPDHWYHYKELNIVNVQNCYVSDAFVRKASDVFVTYRPVCKVCHETGVIGTAIVSEEENYIKAYYCDCGGQTTVIIKIII